MNEGAGPRTLRPILCAGRLYCDLVMGGLCAPPLPGQEVYASSLALTAGGGAYITAAYLAALGCSVTLACTIPAEPFAGAIAAELAAAALDLSACCHAAAGAEPQITVAMIAGGDRAFVTRRSGPAFPDGLETLIASGRFGHLHIGELASLADAPGISTAAKAVGMTVSSDCAWDAEVLARSDLVQLLRGVDVFLPNQAEADALALHAPIADHAPLVVVKRGAAGAEAVFGSKRLHRPPQPTPVVDTVGAGDAFNAGFLLLWLQGADLGDCLDAGAATAAVALARQGGARGLGRLPRPRPTAQ
ncbi:carbohydrate kinase family protein [Pseudorhodobacter sp.]|uniref:carbohydrate kinase family protein n=1 Tax=Pseudorhodobacter sp. TaxID=1934400 RepID=UPI002647AD86|nr:PfkB family carbohydrate kinase [Pseudorhodobacter sp.]MDN5786075.1 PfkB family carbohydrate kinase [Pseudorhodobacter sp.]